MTTVVADGTLKGSSSDGETDGVFDVNKIKGKLAKRPPKGVGAARKDKAAKDQKDKASKKPKKVLTLHSSSLAGQEERTVPFNPVHIEANSQALKIEIVPSFQCVTVFSRGIVRLFRCLLKP